MHDPYEHDPGMKELHQRDLRNSATPIHQPVVQHCDLAAAAEAGDLDETGALGNDDLFTPGDGDLAVAAHESVQKQIEAHEDDFAHQVTPDEHRKYHEDRGEPFDHDHADEPQLNAYGNVAPDHAIENDVPAPTVDADPLEEQGEHTPFSEQDDHQVDGDRETVGLDANEAVKPDAI